MIMVGIECRGCKASTEFASQFEPNEGTEIEDTQQHINVFYLAHCATCLTPDWEVTKVEPIKFGLGNGPRN